MQLELITREELAPVLNRLTVLEEKSEAYDCLLEEYVSQQFAIRFTKKDPKTLKKEREKANPIILFQMTGKKGTTPVYLFSSLVEYNRRKNIPVNRKMYLESKQQAA